MNDSINQASAAARAPAPDAAPPVQSCASAPVVQPGEAVKVLIVDDEPANLLALEALLEPMQVDVIRATSGRDALKALLDGDFAVILLDVKMPDMDGFETAALVRQRDRSRHTPIIFVTGLRGEENLFKGYYVGAVDVIYKPIVPEILRSKVEMFVELSRKNEQLRRNAAMLELKNRELENSIAELREAQESIARLNAELEQRVAERTAELEWSNEELRQFAYVASHDLQEPLRTIANYTQLLARRYKDNLDDDGREFVRFVVDSVHRMHALLNDMLAYSRVTDSRLGRAGAQTDCEGVLAWVLMNLSAAIQESGAEITHDPLPRVRADESQMVQVFQNLLANAIKYRKSGVSPRVHVSAAIDGDECLISVKDNGIGIEAEYRDKIFGVFKRLHGKEYPGTGIGLAIVKKIVERNGGRVWLDSTPGEGSTFYFTLPLV